MITESQRMEGNNLTELKTKIDKLKDQQGAIRWIFRGDRKYGHKAASIKSSLERFFERERIEPRIRNDVEAELIREFKRAYHQYAYHLPDSNSIVEWLSLMQHHGAPTRLVDFTYSFYVAAYFALEDALKEQEEDGEYIVWAINSNWALETSLMALTKKHSRISKTLDILAKPATESRKLTKAQEIFFTEPYVKFALPQNPFRLNERLRIQKGVFVLQGDLRYAFMDNLEALTGKSKPIHVIQITLDKRRRREMLKELHHMNITRTSLFPGLDGYTKSLGVYLPGLENILAKEQPA